MCSAEGRATLTTHGRHEHLKDFFVQLANSVNVPPVYELTPITVMTKTPLGILNIVILSFHLHLTISFLWLATDRLPCKLNRPENEKQRIKQIIQHYIASEKS